MNIFLSIHYIVCNHNMLYKKENKNNNNDNLSFK